MFCHIEGVNFDATIYDTNDLSTIRGSSDLLGNLHTCVLTHFRKTWPTTELVTGGASKALLRLPSEPAPREDDIKKTILEFCSSSLWRHFSLAWGIGKDECTAVANAMIQSLQIWSVPPPDRLSADYPDFEDFTRPATVKIKSQRERDKREKLSASVMQRRKHGRSTRPALFKEGDKLLAPWDFDDIVWINPECRSAFRTVVRDKLAVVKIDGAGVSELKTQFEEVLGAGSFSSAMTAFQEELDTKLRAWVFDEGLTFHYPDTPEKQFSQLDVLFSGGDDTLFFMPAHSVMSFVSTFMNAVAEPFCPGEEKVKHLQMHHRIGVAIAHYKTPIRQLLACAGQLEDLVRQGDVTDQSGVAFAVFESAVPPNDDMAAFWRRLYGDAHQPKLEVFSASQFEAFASLCIETITITEDEPDGTLSTTQIHRALQKLRAAGTPVSSAKKGDNGTDEASAEVVKVLTDHLKRMNRDTDVEFLLNLPAFNRPTALLLAQIAQLHPYMTPKPKGGYR